MSVRLRRAHRAHWLPRYHHGLAHQVYWGPFVMLIGQRRNLYSPQTKRLDY